MSWRRCCGQCNKPAIPLPFNRPNIQWSYWPTPLLSSPYRWYQSTPNASCRMHLIPIACGSWIASPLRGGCCGVRNEEDGGCWPRWSSIRIGPSKTHRWGSLHRVGVTWEVIIVFVGVLEIVLPVGVSAEANAQTVQDEVLLGECNLAVFFLAGECLLNLNLLRLRHGSMM